MPACTLHITRCRPQQRKMSTLHQINRLETVVDVTTGFPQTRKRLGAAVSMAAASLHLGPLAAMPTSHVDGLWNDDPVAATRGVSFLDRMASPTPCLSPPKEEECHCSDSDSSQQEFGRASRRDSRTSRRRQSEPYGQTKGSKELLRLLSPGFSKYGVASYKTPQHNVYRTGGQWICPGAPVKASRPSRVQPSENLRRLCRPLFSDES